MAIYEQFISGWPKPRKEPNCQIFTIQAGHFDIAPPEQFISGWPSQERSQLTRSSHFELGLPFLTFRHMNKFISDPQNPEENQTTRSLHFKPGWPFFTLCHTNSLSAAGQAQKGKPSPERSQMTRSAHFKRSWPFDIAPYAQFISGWPSPEEAKLQI